MSDEDESVAVEAAPQKSNKILPIMLVVNTLLVAGVLVFVIKHPSAQAAAPQEHGGGEVAAAREGGGHGVGEKAEGGGEGEGSEGLGPTMRLDTFIVQVRAAEGDRYAHMTIELELGSEIDKKAVESRTARIRDVVIGHLSDRAEDELRGSEGLGRLKESLMKKLGEAVPGHRIRGLFITEFIIQ